MGSGKVFAPVSCSVSDKTNDLKYTLFDTADSCANNDVDLNVNFNEEANMWTISHTLFLLGNYRKSSFELSCDVIVCEKSGDSAACKAVAKACLAVDGAESEWGAWDTCSVSCGGGTQSRKRTCTNPAPAYGGKDCAKALSEEQACNPDPCPVHGNWAEYGNYGACSVTCGDGKKTRSRGCTNPAPAHGGNDCVGEADQTEDCNNKACPVHGDYGACSKTCGDGTKTRTRTCSNPAPAHGGDDCTGNAADSDSCNEKKCPIDGKWSDYGAFTDCSKSCGGGTQSKSRTCTNPAPQFDGKDCEGEADLVQDCNADACPQPIHGKWSDYGEWGACNATCGGGEQIRERNCTNPEPAHGGDTCTGETTESQPCNEQICTGCINMYKIAFEYSEDDYATKQSTPLANCHQLNVERCPNKIAYDVLKNSPNWGQKNKDRLGVDLFLVKHACCDRCAAHTGPEITSGKVRAHAGRPSPTG